MSNTIGVCYTIESSSLDAIAKKATEVMEAVNLLQQKVSELNELKLGVEICKLDTDKKIQQGIQSIELNSAALAKAIFDKRDELRMTLRQVGEATGIGPSGISRLENNLLPDLLTYAKICAWLEVSMDTFFKYQTLA